MDVTKVLSQSKKNVHGRSTQERKGIACHFALLCRRPMCSQVPKRIITCNPYVLIIAHLEAMKEVPK